MSNDDGFAPPPEDTSESGLGGLADQPSGGTSGAAPSGPEGAGPGSLDPTQAMPSDGASGAPTPPLDPTQAMPGTTPPEPPPVDSTQVMPTAATPPSNPVQSGAGIPPIVPGAAPGAGVPGPGGDVPLEEEFDDEPWYANPRAIAAVVVGVLVLALVIVLFFLLTGDDNGAIEESTDPVSLVILRSDSGGDPLATSLSVSVTAREGAPDNYVWITPADAVPGQAALETTDATGRAEFRWGPGDGADSGWATTVEMAEAVPPEGDQVVSGIGATCELERGGSTENLVVSTNVVVSENGDSLAGVGTYNFPNATFRAGDRVTCTMDNQIAAPPPTTVPEETTTVPETTTTTTVPETTTTTTTTTPPTTAAPTTAAPTTAAPTTAAPTTAAPTTVPADPTVADFLTANGLTGFRDLLIQVGLLGQIESSTQPFTLFAATDQAVTDFLGNFDPSTSNLTDIMNAQLSYEGALESTDLSTLPDIDVEFGGPQPLDFAANPPTIGGANLIDVDNAVENTSPGFVHVVDEVLAVVP